MKILLAGATGYIGSAVLRALDAAGHEVTAVVRTDDAADRIRSTNVTPVLGDMRDRDLLTRLASESDAAIHAAATGDADSADADRDLTEAVIAGLGDRGAAFIRTGGIWVHGAGDSIVEDTPPQRSGHRGVA